MYSSLQDFLDQISRNNTEGALRWGLKGIEKESLRATADGRLAKTPHPEPLGAPLTHPHITTDYSEALMELVTSPMADTAEALDQLNRIHQFVYTHLPENEQLWATSMPCIVPREKDIPIARYGRSNAARMKEVYRVGLGHRYSRVMQAIAGVHFNYSLPQSFWSAYQRRHDDNRPMDDIISDGYFGLVRNYLRHDWLTLYLFGASPAVCDSFFRDQPEHDLDRFDEHTVYRPDATSLRMSDLGYQNKIGLGVGLNSLDEYIDSLDLATRTVHLPFARLGLMHNGRYRQLNTHQLQIANEYYSAIRPKQVQNDMERPTLALRRRGVGYVEVRSLDVNPYDPLGVNLHQMYFLEAFLLFCAMQDSPPIGSAEREIIQQNQNLVAKHGRRADLTLRTIDGREKPLRSWAQEILTAMQPICDMLDGDNVEQPYTVAWRIQHSKVENDAFTPSATLLTDMRHNGEAFFQLGHRLSRRHRDQFHRRPLAAEQTDYFQQLTVQSHRQQAEMEAAETMTFAEYLARYYFG